MLTPEQLLDLLKVLTDAGLPLAIAVNVLVQLLIILGAVF